MTFTPAMGVVLGGAGLLALSACAVTTQVDALQPVAGDAVTGVTVAAADVLISQGVAIKVVPVCRFGSGRYVCSGETMSGDKIRITAEGEDPQTMRVMVADEPVYTGSIDEVLTRAARR